MSKNRFFCNDCGKYFDYPKESEECISECWGLPHFQIEYSCPYCSSSDFEEVGQEQIMKGADRMTIFKENKKTGLSCGVNDFGELFLGNDKSGYNLPDNPENRELILADFDRYNDERSE